MKTLIFTGTPRKNGDTMALVCEVIKYLNGEYKIVHAYESNIQPCVDCRYCRENDGCRINDEMQDVYNYISQCDNILIASPLYFSELTGRLLNIASRLQQYFCAQHFRNIKPIKKEKKGGIILVGGGSGSIEKAAATARILLRQMNCRNIAPAVFSHNTNNISAKDDAKAMQNSRELALFFNN